MIGQNESQFNGMFATIGPLAAADADFCVNDLDISSSVEDDVLSMTNSEIPAEGRNVQATLANSGTSSADFSLEIAGRDHHGKQITEVLGPLVEDTPSVGEKIFCGTITVTVVSVDTAPSTNDVLDVGFGDKVGLPFSPHSEDQIVFTEATDGGPYADTATTVGSSTEIDLDNKAFKAAAFNGSAVGAGDILKVRIWLEPRDVYRQR